METEAIFEKIKLFIKLILAAQAKALLKGFDFNSAAMLSSMLFKPWAVNTATGVITITGLVPTLDIIFPEGATHEELAIKCS